MKPVLLFAAALLLAAVASTSAATQTFAPGFSERIVSAGGRTIYYRIGGSGPAVVLLHGFGDTGQMWAPLAPRLAVNHTVIVPDLPGLGLSRPESASARYDMASVARSIHALMLQLGIHRAAVVGHDIGLMVAYAYAAQFPSEVSKLALIDAPIPGVGPWVKVLLIQDTPQFHLFGPYAERLVAGHERLYLDHILGRQRVSSLARYRRDAGVTPLRMRNPGICMRRCPTSKAFAKMRMTTSRLPRCRSQCLCWLWAAKSLLAL